MPQSYLSLFNQSADRNYDDSNEFDSKEQIIKNQGDATAERDSASHTGAQELNNTKFEGVIKETNTDDQSALKAKNTLALPPQTNSPSLSKDDATTATLSLAQDAIATKPTVSMSPSSETSNPVRDHDDAENQSQATWPLLNWYWLKWVVGAVAVLVVPVLAFMLLTRFYSALHMICQRL